MFSDLLYENNNLQLQLSDFEDENSIKLLETIITSFKMKNKPVNNGFCKCCGSYKFIGWGRYWKKYPDMYIEDEYVRVKRFRCKTCGKTFQYLLYSS